MSKSYVDRVPQNNSKTKTLAVKPKTDSKVACVTCNHCTHLEIGQKVKVRVTRPINAGTKKSVEFGKNMAVFQTTRQVCYIASSCRDYFGTF